MERLPHALRCSSRQLTEPLAFTDALAANIPASRRHTLSSPRRVPRIRPRAQFENIYVPLQASPSGTSHGRGLSQAGTPGVLAPQTPPERQPAPAWSG